MPVLAVLVTLLSGLSAAAAPAPAFDVAARRTIPGSGKTPLALVVQEGSAWDGLGVVEREVAKASEIFSRCGRPLGETTVLVVRWAPGTLATLRDENPYKAPPQAAVMEEPRLPTGRPLGFLFAKDAVPSTAKAFNKSAVAALSRQHAEAQKLLDTLWITADQGLELRRPDIAPSYSTLAHELTHVLGNLPHVAAPYNLMSNAEVPGAKTGDLDDDQCAAVRSY